MAWTVEMIDEMTRLTRLGSSAAMVGRALGLSRGAIIGKAQRIGLRLNDQAWMVSASYRSTPGRREAFQKMKRELRPHRNRSVRSEPPFVIKKPGRIMFLAHLGGWQ